MLRLTGKTGLYLVVAECVDAGDSLDEFHFCYFFGQRYNDQFFQLIRQFRVN